MTTPTKCTTFPEVFSPVMEPTTQQIREAVNTTSDMEIGRRITILWNCARIQLEGLE